MAIKNAIKTNAIKTNVITTNVIRTNVIRTNVVSTHRDFFQGQMDRGMFYWPNLSGETWLSK